MAIMRTVLPWVDRDETNAYPAGRVRSAIIAPFSEYIVS